MGIDYAKAVRILALREVAREESTPEYSLRRVLRWYSRTFHTPLHVVYRLPVHDILVAYYEETFQGWKDNSAAEYLEELRELSMTEEEAAAEAMRRARDAAEDWRLARESEEENAAAEARAAKKRAAAEKKRLDVAREEAKELQAILGDEAPTPGLLPGRTARHNVVRPKAPVAEQALDQDAHEPDVKMTFISLEELDRLSETDGLVGLE